MNTEGPIQTTAEPHGRVSRRFRVWRLPDGRFQVIVDESCGFIIEFDGNKFKGHDGSVSSADAWFSINGRETIELIDALRTAPEGEPIVGVC